mmetsp:Transcript_8215/g.16419  ORF Transcript_8215/g.16419 Transcript_8215/m.16419 type:complete len:241 (+) Transcript_8215:49-771(+)
MLRYVYSLAVIAAAADAFQTPALNGLVGARMAAEPAQISRKDLLTTAAGVAVVAMPAVAGAASLDPNTGFPVNGGSREKLCGGSASAGCQPMTQAASILDKQKTVLAGKITVAANKVPVLTAAVEKMKTGKKPKMDRDYVLRYSALYLTTLVDAMEQYCLRDANGAKAAGGAGLPKFKETLKPATASSLYSYVDAVKTEISSVSAAAKSGDFDGVTKAAAAIKSAADSFISTANPPIVFN